MQAGEKAALIALVRASPLPRKQVLAQLGVAQVHLLRLVLPAAGLA
jgi:hypothetical protein